MAKKYKQFKQGIYKPIYPQKVNNEGSINYRSSLELKLMIWCDKNARVVEWGSENVIVPYISPVDNRVHRYLVDFYIKVKENTKIIKYLIEIKPKNQTIPPKPSKRKKESTVIYEQAMWAINQAKWKAAKQFANNNGMKFMIITELDLETLNGK